MNTSDRPAPRPAYRAINCGRPSNESPGGTSGIPASAAASGSHTIHRRPGGTQPPRQVLLQRRLVPARIPYLTRRRVEADEGAGQPHQLVATRRDGLTDASLGGRQRHRQDPNNSLYRMGEMTDAVADTDLLHEAKSLIDLAAERDIALRLVGGLAIRLLTPDLPPRGRMGQDLDFASASSTRRALIDMLTEQGYDPDKNFNALYGNKQLYFAHGNTGLAIDVLIDKLHMCHTLEFADRLTRMPYTLDAVDLLMSKLQIVELNEKDADDCLRLLVTFPLEDSDDAGAIDLRVFRSLVADDWGWWRTVTLNLERITALLNGGARPAIEGGKLDARTQLQALGEAAESAPKSRRWKMRARIGERKRWYDVPEETPHE